MLDPVGSQAPDQLRAALEEARTRLLELEDALADAREELEAVREINRELLAAQNRTGS
jgi:hypothetical protein